VKYETCIVCHEKVNVSILMKPTTGYICPRCEKQTSKNQKKLAKVKSKVYREENTYGI